MNRFVKLALALNLAGLVRAFRRGPLNAAACLVQSYDKLDPFGVAEVSRKTLQDLNSIPERDLAELVSQGEPILLEGRWQFVDGALPFHDLLALLTLLTDWRPNLILEIGTYHGVTTASLALNAPKAVVHTLDLPLEYDPAADEPGTVPKDDFHLIKQRQVGRGYASLRETNVIVQHYADSAKWDFAPVRGASFFFIDGAHTYEYARNDTEKCRAVAADRARFVLHDCDERHAGVVRYLRELVQQGVKVVRVKGTSIAFFDLERGRP